MNAFDYEGNSMFRDEKSERVNASSLIDCAFMRKDLPPGHEINLEVMHSAGVDPKLIANIKLRDALTKFYQTCCSSHSPNHQISSPFISKDFNVLTTPKKYFTDVEPNVHGYKNLEDEKEMKDSENSILDSKNEEPSILDEKIPLIEEVSNSLTYDFNPPIPPLKLKKVEPTHNLRKKSIKWTIPK